MGADITRDSYDEPQQYRQLVNQQGRVTLDADLNEAQTILREETRKEALDFVGPAGSPDDGYHIRVPSPLPSGWKPFDFQIDAGTLYVGGLRVELPLKTRWSQQTDWLDQPTLKADRSSMREAIVLRLSEQEVSAVEDNAVREVALGGPDTAQRLRLLRHVARFDVEANDCKTALEQVLTALSAEGLEFKPATLRLLPKARLRVSFTNPPKPADKCEPAAQGGYLEAANQCLRVQVSGSNKVLWGFDDASALYRVDIVKIDTTKGETTLRLQTDPVDEEHYPRSEWVFEVLRATARLANGEYVAASSGVVAKLKGSYDPDERTLTLDKALVAPFKAGVKLPPVFLRVWQEELTVVANQQLKLGTTGVQIRLNAGARPLGAFWRFAVRPNTPAEIFPKRYLKSGQPPEGPRQWLCPLAFIHWNEDGVHAKIDDCRPVFDNLVELTARKTGGGCCTVTLGPDDLEKKTLQATVDSLAEKGTATVCLLPGVYALPEPLRLTAAHNGLILEACRPGVVLRAATDHEDAFLDGLVVVTGAKGVTFTGLTFQPPQVHFAKAKGRLASIAPDVLQDKLRGPDVRDLTVSIGLRVVQCTDLTVCNCTFRFDDKFEKNLFAAGILAGGDCSGLHIRGNRFDREPDGKAVAGEPYQFRIGLSLTPALLSDGKPEVDQSVHFRGLSLLPAGLDRAVIRANEFRGLTVAAFVYAVTGAVEAENNLVRGCAAGFWFLSLRSLAFTADVAADLEKNGQKDVAALVKGFAEKSAVLVLGSVLTRCYPLPENFQPGSALIKLPDVTRPRPQAPLNVARRFGLLLGLLAACEKNAKLEDTNPSGRRLSLRLTSNDIECRGPTDLGGEEPVLIPASTCLVVWDDIDAKLHNSLGGTLLLSANKLSEQHLLLPVALLLRVERCTVTGNVIANERARIPVPNVEFTLIVFSLLLAPPIMHDEPPRQLVAVTGNVFLAPPILPSRFSATATLPAPLNGWEFLNTILPSV